MTREDLNEMEAELLEHLEFAKKVQANTKAIEKQLTLIKLAKIGIQSTAVSRY